MSYGTAAVRGGMWGMRLGALLGPLGSAVGTVAGAAIAVGGAYLASEMLANQMKKADEEASEELDETEDEGACAECGERTLPENPDDLLEEGWEEEEHRAPNRRRFRNPETGETIEFDTGQPGKPGWRGRDHYHRPNPNATGDSDRYLDRYGNPVPKNSQPSHIPPGTRINSNSGGLTS